MKTSLKTTACLLMLTSTGINQAMAKSYTNFIIILMDDMGYGDLRSNGAIGYDMPNTEKMQREGMTFTHYYAPQAVSGASRAGLLTGCYPNRIGLSGAPFPGSPTGIHDQETTIAEMLKQKGYTCAAFGKWHLGDQKEFLPLRHGFDEFYGIPYSNDMWPGHPTLKFPDLPLIEGENTIAHNPDQSCFTTDFTQRAVKFIQKNRKKPFFLYLAHPMPHVPLFVSDKFKGKSSCGLYGDVLMELDWSIGEILNTLKKEKLDKNTLVIVISDNGPWLNYGNHAGNTGGLREGKGASFEGGQRVPCIMHWKGHVPEGSLCNKLASGIDILATFAEIADTPMPSLKTDGVSLLPLLQGDSTACPRKYFSYYYRENDLEAVTDGRFKLVFPHKYRSYEGFLPGNNGKPGPVNEFKPLKEIQLYDLWRDPGERYNIIDMYPEKVQELARYAEGVRQDLGDNLTGNPGNGRREPGRVNKNH